MKVIQVTGYSGSGKTTFIRSLIPLLTQFGPVGTVKHTGHHAMELPPGKDTTEMFLAGAKGVAGIDTEKLHITFKSTSFTDALDFLAGHCIAITVIEGFKGSVLPKIVIGDFEAENCILRNPQPEEVLHFLHRFPDYITMDQLVREIAAEPGAASCPGVLTYAGKIVPVSEVHALHGEDRPVPALAAFLEKQPGVLAARVVLRHGSLFGLDDELLIAIAAEDGTLAGVALQETLERARSGLERAGIALR